MWSKINRHILRLRTSASTFLPPFLSTSSLALLAVWLLNLRNPLISLRDILLVSLISASLGLIIWYLRRDTHRFKPAVRSVSQITLPVLIVLSVALSYFAPTLYEVLAAYGAVLVLLTAAIALHGVSQHGSEDDISKRLFVALCVLIIVIGTLVCAWEAYSTPTISVDEAHSSISASSILTRGLPYFPNTEVVYSRSWVDLFPIAAAYKLFGFSEMSARLPSVLAYFATLILFLRTVRSFASRGTSVIAVALLAMNPWVLYYGSYARMYIFLLLFSTVFSYLMLRQLTRPHPVILYALLPLTLLLGLFSERTFLLFVPAYGILVLLSLPRTKYFWQRSLLYGTFLLSCALQALVILNIPIGAFVSRYVVGFNNGANPLANASLQFTPLNWLSHFGLPTAVLLTASAFIISKGDRRARAFLALFWFAEILVDVLIYSNFPARRFNYTFILVELYALVLIFGITLLARYSKRAGIACAAVLMAFSIHTYYERPPFPDYADFSTIRLVPENSVIVGYPTSPLVFYNLKYDRHDVIMPFITDRIERLKYEENGTEIYSGGPYVSGVTPLNELRKKQDVYIFFEKTRLDFLNERTNDFIFTECIPLTPEIASTVARTVQQRYKSEVQDLSRGTILILRCPKLPS